MKAFMVKTYGGLTLLVVAKDLASATKKADEHEQRNADQGLLGHNLKSIESLDVDEVLR